MTNVFPFRPRHAPPPHRQHPCKLVGEHCQNGVYVESRTIQRNQVITFKNLGILMVKKEKVVESLQIRKDANIDPFKGKWRRNAHFL